MKFYLFLAIFFIVLLVPDPLYLKNLDPNPYSHKSLYPDPPKVKADLKDHQNTVLQDA
jgi:hypothetical protein